MNMDPYSSHQEAILWAINKLGHNIKAYELGAGNYSTKLLHDNVDKKLITVETDQEWLNLFLNLQGPKHEFVFIQPQNWKKGLENLDLECDLAFIDSFDGPSRSVAMNLFRDKAKLVVVHDQENVFRNPSACYEGQFEAVKSYKFCKEFISCNIITVVLSNIIDI